MAYIVRATKQVDKTCNHSVVTKLIISDHGLSHDPEPRHTVVTTVHAIKIVPAAWMFAVFLCCV